MRRRVGEIRLPPEFIPRLPIDTYRTTIQNTENPSNNARFAKYFDKSRPKHGIIP